MIDIIIPAYNAHKTIEQTLCSIAYQDMSELVNVYIVNDCSDYDYHKFVEFFSHFIKIKELKLDKNVGPGLARQFGLEHSKGKYVIFMDSDDCFADCFSLKRLYIEIENENVDAVVGSIAEETTDGFIIYNESRVWLHGKIYRKEYLEKNKIFFNETRLNEDNGFNQLFFLSNPKCKYIQDKTYIWRNNKESITRKKNGEFSKNGIFGYIYNITWALDIAITRGYDNNLIANLSYGALLYVYYLYLQSSEELHQRKLLYKMQRIKQISDEYQLPQSEKLIVMQSQFELALNDESKKYILNPKISFDNYLTLIDEVGDTDD